MKVAAKKLSFIGCDEWVGTARGCSTRQGRVLEGVNSIVLQVSLYMQDPILSAYGIPSTTV